MNWKLSLLLCVLSVLPFKKVRTEALLQARTGDGGGSAASRQQAAWEGGAHHGTGTFLDEIFQTHADGESPRDVVQCHLLPIEIPRPERLAAGWGKLPGNETNTAGLTGAEPRRVSIVSTNSY